MIFVLSCTIYLSDFIWFLIVMKHVVNKKVCIHSAGCDQEQFSCLSIVLKGQDIVINFPCFNALRNVLILLFPCVNSSLSLSLLFLFSSFLSLIVVFKLVIETYVSFSFESPIKLFMFHFHSYRSLCCWHLILILLAACIVNKKEVIVER